MSTPIPPSSFTSASRSPNCPHCGRTIPADAALGACPHCLLAAGLASEPAAPVNATPPPSPTEIAPEFPQLEILELLGRGGMGAVYKARQKSLDRLVALKLLRTGLDTDPSFADRFTREARALGQLNHPGIVTLYEFGRTESGRFFILMEFVDGLNLRQLLAAGRLAPREALAIVPPLCDALQYAHNHGLIHRDIKPENILIDRLGRVKIADFGLAKLATTHASPNDDKTPSPSDSGIGRWSLVTDHSGLTETGKIMGTPEYMAPEQRERPAAVDHRADIYALGVVLYQMLTGELPDAKQLQPPSHRVHLDIRLDEIVLRALEINPALRYTSASELKTQVETVAGVPSSKGNPSTTPATIPPDHQKRRLKFWLLRIAPLALLFLLALRLFVIAPYRIEGSSVEPELPAGSLAFVYKLKRQFSPGDIVAYRHSEKLTYVARVSAAGPLDGQLLIVRNNLSPLSISSSAIIGKVVFNTRNSQSPSAGYNHTQNGIIALIFLSASALLIWLWKVFKRLPVAAATFATIYILHLAWAFSTANELPARVASHFGMNGRADGFMSRTGYLTFICLFPLGFGLLLQGAALLVHRLPHEYINVPHRAIWLAPDRRPQLVAILQSWFAALSCGVVIFSAQLHTLTLLANRLTPPRLPDIALFTLLGFSMVLLLWAIGLLLRFAEPHAAEKLHTRRSLIIAIVSATLLGFFTAPSIIAWQETSPAPNTLPLTSSAPQRRFPNDPVRIKNDGAYFIGNSQVSFKKLEHHLATLRKATPAPNLHVEAEEKTPYPQIVEVMNSARKHGVSKITLKAGQAPDANELIDVPQLATSWLQQIDDGHYAESWAASSPHFQQAISQKAWTDTLSASRPTLGKLISRFRFVSEKFETLPNTPHIVTQFSTRFENQSNAVETVTFTRDTDGTWRASGYFIK